MNLRKGKGVVVLLDGSMKWIGYEARPDSDSKHGRERYTYNVLTRRSSID